MDFVSHGYAKHELVGRVRLPIAGSHKQVNVLNLGDPVYVLVLAGQYRGLRRLHQR